MKFNISRPPTGGNTKEQLERLTSWLYVLSENLNVTLANLGEENFSEGFQKKLLEGKEERNDNV
ncbi:MAG: hypothetical protein IJF69_05220 [Clostridia bacterium]|nr:hypothetical protein [Clostridia bacterium]